MSEPLTLSQIDEFIEAAQQEGDASLLVTAIQKALVLTGRSSDESRLLEAKYLWFVKNAYATKTWPETDTYDTFAKWVRGYYQHTPTGKRLPTVYNAVAIHEFYHLYIGCELSWMVRCGKAKLERMKSVAMKTVQNGDLDPDVRAVLEDEQVGYADCMAAYKSRIGETGESEDENGDSDEENSQVAFRLLTEPPDGGQSGVVEAWVDGQRIEVGHLNMDEETQEYSLLLCERAKVQII